MLLSTVSSPISWIVGVAAGWVVAMTTVIVIIARRAPAASPPSVTVNMPAITATGRLPRSRVRIRTGPRIRVRIRRTRRSAAVTTLAPRLGLPLDAAAGVGVETLEQSALIACQSDGGRCAGRCRQQHQQDDEQRTHVSPSHSLVTFYVLLLPYYIR